MPMRQHKRVPFNAHNTALERQHLLYHDPPEKRWHYAAQIAHLSRRLGCRERKVVANVHWGACSLAHDALHDRRGGVRAHQELAVELILDDLLGREEIDACVAVGELDERVGRHRLTAASKLRKVCWVEHGHLPHCICGEFGDHDHTSTRATRTRIVLVVQGVSLRLQVECGAIVRRRCEGKRHPKAQHAILRRRTTLGNRRDGPCGARTRDGSRLSSACDDVRLLRQLGTVGRIDGNHAT
mmetsp:Transcript_26742/g.68026  ORF Transcript_26742/g.68026 Transcript_26742/m.68026 type:complete len:241 (-) Transcript_26742:328-1050(-)